MYDREEGGTREWERGDGGGGAEPVVDTRTVAATAQSGSTADGGKTIV